MKNDYQTPEDHKEIVKRDLVLNQIAIANELVIMIYCCSFLQRVGCLHETVYIRLSCKTNDERTVICNFRINGDHSFKIEHNAMDRL